MQTNTFHVKSVSYYRQIAFYVQQAKNHGKIFTEFTKGVTMNRQADKVALIASFPKKNTLKSEATSWCH